MKGDLEIRKLYLFLLFLSLILPALYGISMVATTGGHLAAPLDDTYFHFQTAKNISRGRIFQYSGDAGFVSGTTSILYPFLLAPFFWLGFAGVKILLVTWGLGVLFLFLTSLAAFHAGKEMISEKCGLLAAILILLNGHIMWHFFSGMETGFLTFLIITALWQWILWRKTEKGRFLVFSFILFTLVSLTRPEGSIILGLIFLMTFIPAYRIYGKKYLLSLTAFIPFLLYMILLYVKTGGFETSGMIAKTVSCGPYYSFFEKVAKLADNFAFIIYGYYRNLSPNYFSDLGMSPLFPAGSLYPFLLFPPFALLLALFGVVSGTIKDREKEKKIITLVPAVILFSGLCLVTNSEVYNAHYFRYLIPFQPLFLLLVAAGLWNLSRLPKKPNLKIFSTGAVILVLISIPSLFYWAWLYGESTNDIFQQHRRTSWWLKDHTPEDSIIGITEAGVIAYFSERRIYDFVGLGTPDQAIHWRHGLGSAYERLENLPPEDLPDYIVSYPFLWGDPDFLGKQIYCAPLRSNVTTMGYNFAVFEQSWENLNSGKLPVNSPEGLVLKDKLDVADLKSEKDHDYLNREATERYNARKFPNPRNFFFKSEIRESVITDGGRAVTYYEEFDLTVEPEKDALLKVRTNSSEAVAVVKVNEQIVGRFVQNSEISGGWSEPVVEISKEAFHGPENRFRIEYDRGGSCAPQFNSFHYWIYQ